MTCVYSALFDTFARFDLSCFDTITTAVRPTKITVTDSEYYKSNVSPTEMYGSNVTSSE